MGATASLEILETPKERRNNVPHCQSSHLQFTKDAVDFCGGLMICIILYRSDLFAVAIGKEVNLNKTEQIVN